jgi:hypothetical protein
MGDIRTRPGEGLAPKDPRKGQGARSSARAAVSAAASVAP